jgi:LCP family protein required for cell wall assembly
MAHRPAPPPEPEPRLGRARERQQRRAADQRLPKLDWTWAVIGGALVGIIGVVMLILLSTSGETTAQGAPAAGVDMAAEATAAPPLTDATPGLVAVAVPTVVIKPWDGKTRVTILVMGLDKRPGEQGRSYRTDTLILVSIDPASQSVGMLSIPRDLVVPIPNRADMQPINTAFVYGELERPGFGPRLTAETVQYNLGIRVDHYVVVQFEAVIRLIDAIGGITIDVPKTIDDKEFPDLYTYGYDPFYIEAGVRRMDGLLALKYARTRHQDSDFDRTERQQQVLLAVRNQALGDLPRLIAAAPTIWGEISTGVETDLSFDQILSLGLLAKDIPDGAIKRASLTGDYVQVTQHRGAPVVTINRATIVKLLVEVFGPTYNQ